MRCGALVVRMLWAPSGWTIRCANNRRRLRTRLLCAHQRALAGIVLHVGSDGGRNGDAKHPPDVNHRVALVRTQRLETGRAHPHRPLVQLGPQAAALHIRNTHHTLRVTHV
eukprot:724986-Pyramimonas_sp.AAC.4